MVLINIYCLGGLDFQNIFPEILSVGSLRNPLQLCAVCDDVRTAIYWVVT